MKARETAWRIFAAELNASSLEKKSDEEKSPSYIITPLGTMVNRVLIAGVMTEKENIGTDDEPMWKARIQDVTGSYFLNAGRYQPEAAAAMANIDTPTYVAVIGKIKTYSPEPGRVYVSLRPEKIIQIDEDTRNLWVLEAAQSLWSRLLVMKKTISNPEASIDDLIALGLSKVEAEGTVAAIDAYGNPDSGRYLSALQSALKMLLPDGDIDFGVPEEHADEPDEIEIDNEDGETKLNKEDTIFKLIEELDERGSKGVPRAELDRRAAELGISETEMEEISESLMEKGLVYEPNLGYLRII